jgi:hypothetical protein
MVETQANSQQKIPLLLILSSQSLIMLSPVIGSFMGEAPTLDHSSKTIFSWFATNKTSDFISLSERQQL